MDGKGRAASVGSGQRAGGERRKCEANVESAGGERERRGGKRRRRACCSFFHMCVSLR